MSTLSQVKNSFKTSFVALSERDFRLVMTGALISSAGTWMQEATVPYVIYHLTGNTALVGWSVFCSTIPTAILTPYGGALADRIDRRKFLMITQIIAGLSAALLAVLWASGMREIWPLFVILFFNGVLAAFSVPAYMSLVPETVSKERMHNAVTINSAQFNAARGFGPILGGLTIAFLGPTWSFAINAASYLAVVYALVVMTRKDWTPENIKHQKVFSDLKDGLRHVRSNPAVRTAIPLAVTIATLGMPIFWLMPSLAKVVYHSGSVGYGLMAGSMGIGTIVGVLVLGIIGQRWARDRLLKTTLPMYAFALFLFSVIHVYAIGLVLLVAAGACYICAVSCLLNSVQLSLSNQFRSRVMAIYALGVTASFPTGAVIQGILARHIGPSRTLSIFAALLVVLALLLNAVPGIVARLNSSMPSASPVSPPEVSVRTPNLADT